MSVLFEDQLSRYHRDGFVFPVRVMDEREANACRRALEQAEARAADADARSLLRGFAAMLLPAVDRLARDRRIVDAVADILGPDVMLWGAGFFIKEPHSGKYVSWHQDLNYWGLDQEDEITAWVAFTDATIDNGAMRFLPGSHRERVGHRDTFAADNLLSRGQELAVDVDEAPAVDVVLEAGEMSLHHGLLLHSSRPNRSADRRIGLALRYIRPDMRQVVGARDYASLVRGEDRHGHFQPYPRARGVLDPADLEAARAVRADKERFLFQGVERQIETAASRRR